MLGLTVNLKNLLGILFVTFFLHNFANYKKQNKKSVIIFLIIFLCLLIAAGHAVSIILNEEQAGTIGDLLTIISFCAVPYFVLKRKKLYVFALFGLVTNSAIDFFVETIVYFFPTSSAAISNLIFSAVTLILLIVVYIVQRQTQSNVSVDIFERIPPIVYAIIFLLSMVSYYMMMIPKDADYSDGTYLALRALSSIVIVACIIYMIIKYTETIKTENLLQFQVSTQIEQYKMLRKSNSEIRKFRHDYNNNMLALSSLLEAEKISEAKEYIKQMNFNITGGCIEFATGNYLADAIISYKASRAAADGITLTFDGTIPANGISNNDLSIILSNLLDNAIRGCEDCTPCEITVKSKESDCGVLLTISNPVKENVDVKKQLETTKKDRLNHGLGIKNIKQTVKKYHGFVSFDCKDNLFTAKIGLMIQNEQS